MAPCHRSNIGAFTHPRLVTKRRSSCGRADPARARPQKTPVSAAHQAHLTVNRWDALFRLSSQRVCIGLMRAPPTPTMVSGAP